MTVPAGQTACPEPSDGLVEALKQNRAVAVIGSGLSLGAGLPPWDQLLYRLVRSAEKTRPKKRPELAAVMEGIASGRYPDAADLLKDILQTTFHSEIARQLQRRMDDLKPDKTRSSQGEPLFENDPSWSLLVSRPTAAHRILVQLPWRALVTTNYDTLLEDARTDSKPPVYQRSASGLGALVQSGRHFILKLHGDVNNTQDIVLARSEYAQAVFDSEAREAVESLLRSGPPFWLGYGHNDPNLDLLLDKLRVQLGVGGGFALVKEGDGLLMKRFRAAHIFPSLLSGWWMTPEYLNKLARAAGTNLVFSVMVERFWDGQDDAEELAQSLTSDLNSVTRSGRVSPWQVRGDSIIELEALAAVLDELRERISKRDSALLGVLRRFGVVRLDGLDLTEGPSTSLISPAPIPPRPENTTPPHPQPANSGTQSFIGTMPTSTSSKIKSPKPTLRTVDGTRVYFKLDIENVPVRLSSKLNKLQRKHSGLLIEISNVINCDPVELAKHYVESDCQNINPADYDEKDGQSDCPKTPVFKAINDFLNGSAPNQQWRNQMFVLADAGMGKSSLLGMLKMTHMIGLWPKGIDCHLHKIGEDTLDKIEAHRPNAHKTVLLLDSLDEDSQIFGRLGERLEQLLETSAEFNKVIFTCRTQFFPKGGESPILKGSHIELAGFECRTVYLDYFWDDKTNEYLAKHFPQTLWQRFKSWVLEQPNFKVEEAKDALKHAKTLQFRPFLLAHIEDLMNTSQEFKTSYDVYGALVGQWLLRTKRLFKKQSRVVEREVLLKICQRIAVHLQKTGHRELPLEALEALTREDPDYGHIKVLDIGGRSLLNRNSRGEYRFAHYSIQEFLVAQRIVQGPLEEPVRQTKQLIDFLLDVYEPDAAYFASIDLTGADLKGANLEKANFKGTTLTQANLEGANLEGANLEGANLEGANLKGANLEGTTFKGARYNSETTWPRGFDSRYLDAIGPDAYLTKSKFNGANLQGVDLSGANLTQAKLTQTNLERANLNRGDFTQANFTQARLTQTTLTDACLKGANLTGADLTGADLNGADLNGADLTRARYDLVTVWPQSFDFRTSGAIGPEANLKGADLSEADLTDADLNGALYNSATVWPQSFDFRTSGAIGPEANLKGADLSEADLKGANLTGTDLKGANLTGTDLKRANLNGALYDSATVWPQSFDFRTSGAIGPEANLKGANLTGTDLNGADLVWADLRGADLRGANLKGANLKGADLSEADLADSCLTGADLTKADLRGTNLTKTDLTSADLTKTDLTDADLTGALYNSATVWPQDFDFRTSHATGPEANLKGADLKGADLRGADLKGADLNGADLNGADLRGANLKGADLSEADLTEADLTQTLCDSATVWPQSFDFRTSGAIGPKANLKGADLSEADLSEADLTGALYDSATVWPQSFDFRTSRAIGPKANLKGADLKGADLNGTYLVWADLTGADLTLTNLTLANLTRGKLSNANLTEASLSDSCLKGADLKGANLTRADLTRADLTRADLTEANLVSSCLKGADLSEADLKGADLNGALCDSATVWPQSFDFRTSGAIGPKANLKGADLSEADLSEADLTGALYNSVTVWPQDFDFRTSGAIGPEANLKGANFIEAALKGADLTRADLKGLDFSRANLTGADLTGANLKSANLTGANLTGADLKSANLTGVGLSSSCLKGADLSEADLSEADLTGALYNSVTVWPQDFDFRTSGAIGPEANLKGANFIEAALKGADLTRADLTRADLTGADLTGADLTGANLKSANLIGANLVGTCLTGANLNEADLKLVRYHPQTVWPVGFNFRQSGAIGPQTNLKGANLKGLDLKEAILNGSELNLANLIQADLTQASLIEAVLEGTDLTGADLTGADLVRANLTGADLTGADLKDADLKGANLKGANLTGANFTDALYDSATVWPQNFDFRTSGAIGPEANLKGADLTGSELTNAYLIKIEYTRALYNSATVWPQDFDFRTSGAIGPKANLKCADLKGADLTGADLTGADLKGVDFSRANLTRTDLTGADLTGANLTHTDFTRANLTRAGLTGANLVSSCLKGTDLKGAKLRNAKLRDANLTRANLTEADLTGADLTGANLTLTRYSNNTVWPEDFNPKKSGAILHQ